MATFIEHSRYTREQGLKLRDKITYKCAWYIIIFYIDCHSQYFLFIGRKILCFKPGDRLENIGKPVPVRVIIYHRQQKDSLIITYVQSNELVLINHAKTNMNLAVHTEWKHR